MGRRSRDDIVVRDGWSVFQPLTPQMDFMLKRVASISVMNGAHGHRRSLAMERILLLSVCEKSMNDGTSRLCLPRNTHDVSTVSIRVDNGNTILVEHDQIQEQTLAVSIRFQRVEEHTWPQRI